MSLFCQGQNRLTDQGQYVNKQKFSVFLSSKRQVSKDFRAICNWVLRKNPPAKKPPDPKPNPIPNQTLPLTPYAEIFPGEFFPDTIQLKDI